MTHERRRPNHTLSHPRTQKVANVFLLSRGHTPATCLGNGNEFTPISRPERDEPAHWTKWSDCMTHLPYKQLCSQCSQRQRNTFTLAPLQTLNNYRFLTRQYLFSQGRPGYNLALRYDKGLLFRIHQKTQVRKSWDTELTCLSQLYTQAQQAPKGQ